MIGVIGVRVVTGLGTGMGMVTGEGGSGGGAGKVGKKGSVNVGVVGRGIVIGAMVAIGGAPITVAVASPAGVGSATGAIAVMGATAIGDAMGVVAAFITLISGSAENCDARNGERIGNVPYAPREILEGIQGVRMLLAKKGLLKFPSSE
ncbi:MAG: hypothetical protein ACMUIS_06795 [bacterium]